MGKFFTKGSEDTILKSSIRWLLTPLQAILATIVVLFHKKPKRNYKYDVAICGLFKNEDRFLEEWIDYHISVGVDHFYMYNNNSDDNYLEKLEKYVKRGIVEIIEWPQKFPQMPAYLDCYEKYHREAKWIGYIDIDEFVCPKYASTIREWLMPYSKYPGVLMYWKVFGTGGHLKHDDKQYVIEQYTNCYDGLMSMGKIFINTSYYFPRFKSPHIISAVIKFMGFSINIPPVNEYKKFVCFGLHRVPIFKKTITIQINHYWSKAYDVFIYNKTIRSDVFSADNEEIDKYLMLDPNEKLCIAKDYTIQRYLLKLRLAAHVS